MHVVFAAAQYRLVESGGSLRGQCLNAIRGGNAQWRTTMSHAFRATVMIAAAATALSGMAGERLYAQGADPNAAPNPYKMQENWAQLPEGRKFGAAIEVQVDHSDGKSIWVFDRCGATECTNSTLAPMEKFDSSGKFQKAIGADRFAVPHGLYVDHEGNVCGGDQIAHQVCSRRQGVDDFGQAGNARQRSGLFDDG